MISVVEIIAPLFSIHLRPICQSNFLLEQIASATAWTGVAFLDELIGRLQNTDVGFDPCKNDLLPPRLIQFFVEHLHSAATEGELFDGNDTLQFRLDFGDRLPQSLGILFRNQTGIAISFAKARRV